jgi:isopentenyl diphosphate isomerase/L-lactate dehydrogenase-like FMN-dependent dehydrogenase
MHSRAQFLRYLAASPLLAADPEITAPDQALNLRDFEAPARKALPPAHWGYLATGVDDDATLRANEDGFRKLYLRPRRLVNVETADLSRNVFGHSWTQPFGLAPVGNQMAFHVDGEKAMARAARAQRTAAFLSTAANTGVEDIARELGAPPWYQLYTTNRWPVTERLVKRVEDAGCPVIAVTVDTQAGRRTETFERWRTLDKRDCTVCHGPNRGDFFRRKAMFTGIDTQGLTTTSRAFDWKQIDQLRKLTTRKLLVKGIGTAEDAALCVEHGLDGLIVSNHGGRAEESGRGTIDCLPEVIQAVNGRIPVFLDGGIRRGTDVLKALALGAHAVFIGRPYIWGLAAFGQAGVERVITLLRAELELAMKQNGVTSLDQITSRLVGRL